MLYSNLELLRRIFDEVNFVLEATNGKLKDEIINDAILSRAVVRSLEIIGEASKNSMRSLNLNTLISNGKKWLEHVIS